MTKIRVVELAILALLVGAGAYGVITENARQQASISLAQPAEARPAQVTVATSVPPLTPAPKVFPPPPSANRYEPTPQSPDHAARVECMRLLMDWMNSLARAERDGRADQVGDVNLPTYCDKYLTQ